MEKSNFGEKLKHARIAKGYTQKDLSEKIGVTAVSISYYENGSKNPSFDKLKRICFVLDLDMNEL